MKVLIYGRFSNHHFAIRNVILNICKGLNDKFDLHNNQITVLTNKSHAAFFSECKKLKIESIDIDPDNAWKNQFYTLFKLPKYLKKNHFDLVIFPQITFYYWKKCKTVFYLHDLIEFSVKNQKSLSLNLRKFFYRRTARISDRIITVSEHSRNDIIRLLNYPEKKISVLYDGRDEELVPKNRTESLLKIKTAYPSLNTVKHYVLYVGYLAHPQKNLLFVLNNISDILKKHDLYFLMVGPDGKDAPLIHSKIDKINSIMGEKRVFSTGPVEKNLLPYLYSGAEAFIFVSQYEGFGMPVLEAMSCGCPVITSNSSSLKEIARGYAKLISPDDADSFKIKLEELLNEPRKPIEFYATPLHKFTWNNHVDGLIKLINEL